MTAERTVFALAEDPGLDLWTLAHEHAEWLAWVDASYGNAVYLPMADLAIYEVKMTQTGLIARPMNTQAQDAVEHW